MIYFETNSENKIVYTSFQPFSGLYGLGKSEEELLRTGYLVDEIPTFEHREGYSQVIKYDGAEFSVEYVEVPPMPPSQEEEIAELKTENLELKLALAEMAETQEQQRLETQLALAELAEAVTGGV